jgi:hypothetical protein
MSETDVRDCKLTSIIYFRWGSNAREITDSTVMELEMAVIAIAHFL